jgi:glycosyltransferase involved in cell wall biosynthesis
VKMELISELLLRNAHDVEIFSQGEVVDNQARYFPAFSESKTFHPKVPIRYASSLPIRRVNGFWSSSRLLALFKERHQVAPFDVMIIYNLKGPQVSCAQYAIRQLGMPVILEYEDDAFVDVFGNAEASLIVRRQMKSSTRLLQEISGCIGVSPFLLSRVNGSLPNLLLRGVVGNEYLELGWRSDDKRKNWVVFSGTYFPSKGLEPLIVGWKTLQPPGWELHLAGSGMLTEKLERDAAGCKSIIFHGLLNRTQNAQFLGVAKIGINPHQLSATPGNVFAFKIIEYLAAGNHVITTPMGSLEPELEAGITYMADNSPETVAKTLDTVIRERRYDRRAVQAVHDTYGPDSVASALNRLLDQVVKRSSNPRHNSAKPISRSETTASLNHIAK